MRVWALVYDEDDSHDIGTHEAVIDLFANREQAELIAEFLIGLPRDPHIYGSSWIPVWQKYDNLRVESMKVRR